MIVVTNCSKSLQVSAFLFLVAGFQYLKYLYCWRSDICFQIVLDLLDMGKKWFFDKWRSFTIHLSYIFLFVSFYLIFFVLFTPLFSILVNRQWSKCNLVQILVKLISEINFFRVLCQVSPGILSHVHTNYK